ncbi:MAG: hypothetical protein ABSF27_09590, partial [Candidatus Dormibacteria bacterium]
SVTVSCLLCSPLPATATVTLAEIEARLESPAADRRGGERFHGPDGSRSGQRGGAKIFKGTGLPLAGLAPAARSEC